MYYEQKFENGIFYWRSSPKSEWAEVSRDSLAGRLHKTQRELEAWKIAVANYSLRQGMERLSEEIETRARELLAANA